MHPLLVSAATAGIVLVLMFSFCDISMKDEISFELSSSLSQEREEEDSEYFVIFAGELCRHGSRTPLTYTYSDGQYDRIPIGSLTHAGMRQHFILGALLRQKYVPELLSSSPKEGEVFFISDLDDRCRVSGYSQLAGLYPAGSGQSLREELEDTAIPPNANQTNAISEILDKMEEAAEEINLQTLPALGLAQAVFNEPSYLDENLLFSGGSAKVCPIVQKYMDETIRSPEYKQAVSYFNSTIWQALREQFNAQSNYSLKPQEMSFKMTNKIFDVYRCNDFLKRKNFQFSEDLVAGMEKSALYYKYQYDFIQPFVRNASVSYLLLNISSQMEDVLNGKKYAPKFALYSGHDTNFYPYLVIFLGLDKAIALKEALVPFASNLIFELLESKSSQSEYFVRVIYNGMPLKLQQCSKDPCTLEEFQKMVRETAILNLEEVCQRTTDEEEPESEEHSIEHEESL